jgi:hypothetical protein
VLNKRWPALTFTVSAIAVLTGCVEHPDPPEFGYARHNGQVVIAYPMCSGDAVSAVTLRLSVQGAGDDGTGFKTLWKASAPASATARHGLFTVAGGDSFRTVDHPLAGRLPDAFYVDVKEEVRNGDDGGLSAWVDLSQLRGKGWNSGSS